MNKPNRTERSGLDAVKVLEFPDPKTALCGKLLADMGADVVLIEPPGGASLRTVPPHAGHSGESLLFWYTNANKRSVVLDISQGQERQSFLGLVKDADVLLDPFKPGHLASLGLDDETLFGANPRLILASVTGFGLTGPFRDYASSDIVGTALGGLMGLTGDPSSEPLNPPALQGSQVTSLWATIAIQGAVFRRLKTGQGARLDISMQEAVFDMSETAHSYYLANGDIVKRMAGDHILTCPFRAFKAKDGYAFITAGGGNGWQALLDWMRSVGVSESMLDSMGDGTDRTERRAEVNAAVREFAQHVTRRELHEKGAEMGTPNAPVNSIPEVLQDEQLAFRQFFNSMPDPRDGTSGASHPYGTLPFRGRNGPWQREITAPPRAGQHTAEVLKNWPNKGRAWPEPTEPERVLPLGGVKVMDLCWNMAGPTMGRVLGDLGATMVKVEPPGTGDPSRGLVPFRDRTPNRNGSYTFNDINRNKLSVTINMKHPKSQEVALKLARWADVVLENFTTGTMNRMNIPYQTLADANPRLILGSVTGYGQTGDRRSWPSMHPTVAAMGGLTGLFAYEGGEPQGFGNSYMDYVTGYVGAIGVLDGLLRRELTGDGDHVDISMLESAATLVGTQILDWAVNRHEPKGEGNRAGALGAVLQGCYRCAGDDQWIVVTAPDDRALDALGTVTGRPGSRSAAEAHEALASWALTRRPWDAFRELQEAGIAAGVVSQGPDLTEMDEHLRAREAIAQVPHPELGEIPTAQCPIVLDGKRLEVRFSADALSGHTEQVLCEELGMSQVAYRAFAEEGVV